MRANTSPLKKTLVVTLAVVAVAAVLAVASAVVLDYFAPDYRAALAKRIGARLDAKVAIAAVDVRWSWSGPKLVLNSVRVTRRGQSIPAVRIRSAGLHFSVFDLIRGRRLPDGLTLIAPRLSVVRGANGRLRVRHWARPGAPRVTLADLENLRTRLAFLHIENARVAVLAAGLPDGRAVLSHVDATLDNGEHNQWKVAITADGPAWWPHIQAKAAGTGALTGIRHAHFAIATRGVRALVLARAARDLGPAWAARLSGAAINAQIHGQWRDHALRATRAKISLSALRAVGKPRPVIPALTAVLDVRASAPGVLDIELAHIDGALPGLAAFRLTGHIDTQQPRIRLAARQVPAAPVLALARLRYPAWDSADIGLAIDDLSLTAGRGQPLDLAVDFTRLKVDAPRLGFGPIGGRYTQHGAIHTLRFARAAGAVRAKGFIQGALAISGLGGALSWHRDREGLQLDARDLRLRSHKATVKASGRVRLPPAGPPVVDLTAAMQAPNVARLTAHIPQANDLPNPKLRGWLAKAITAGSLDDARLRVAGPVNRFPFAKPRRGERFHLEMTGHGLDVAYKRNWPPLKNAAGRLVLDGDRLDIAVEHARVLGNTLARSTAHVADVREPVLRIKGRVNNGRAAPMLAFLTRSPLKKRFGKLVGAIDLRGHDDLALRLRIPLKPGLGKVAVAGDIRARDNRLRQAALPGPITGITGRVAFDGDGLTARGLQGKLDGVVLHTDLRPAGGYQHIVTHATVSLPRDRGLLAHYLPKPWPDYGQGRTGVRVAFRVAKKKGRLSDIGVTSDLRGMAIDLPAPAHKRAGARAPLSIKIAPDGQRVDARYDHRIRLAVRLAHGHATRVVAQIGHPANPPIPPDANGLWLGGTTDVVDGVGWFTVVRHVLYGGAAKRSAPAAGRRLAFLGGDLQIGKLRLGQRYFENTHLRAEPMHAVHGWRVNFEGANTQGQITWTAPAQQRTAIAGNLALLALKTRPQGSRQGHTDNPTSPVIWAGVSPSALPRVKVYVQNFKVDGTSFAKTHVDAKALPHGWHLTRFSMRHGALTGTASARWTRADKTTRAAARFDFHGHGLSRLLRTFGYPAPLRARTARVRARLSIAPNGNGLDLRALDGELHFALHHGTLLSVEPGVARVLGLFNLFVLPRRLALNFRDVVDQGLAFDKVRADFKIRNGNAFSKHAVIQAPSSKITIKGRIGLAARDYDQRVTVTPKLTGGMAGVAIASGIFGGPLVGAAVFGLQQLLKKPIEKFSSIGYTLKGSWDNPTITKPSANARRKTP